jgi:hypothetical protein
MRSARVGNATGSAGTSRVTTRTPHPPRVSIPISAQLWIYVFGYIDAH